MNELSLTELIDNYGETKAQLDIVKKDAELMNSEIKKLMTAGSLETVSGSEFKATCKEIKSESFNEDKLLIKLKELGVEGCIKTKEYVDMEELESAIYNGEIEPTKLAECKEVKTQLRLTISKLK